jgi:hypothetical protein
MVLVAVLTITLWVGLPPRITLPQEKLSLWEVHLSPHEVCTEAVRSSGE